MHNVTNFFIGNLAFSDMLMCVTCVPFTLAYAFNPPDGFSALHVYLVFLIQPVTVYVSVFTLTAIAVDRYSATVHPLKKRTSVSTCAAVLTCIWLLSCALVAPPSCTPTTSSSRRRASPSARSSGSARRASGGPTRTAPSWSPTSCPCPRLRVLPVHHRQTEEVRGPGEQNQDPERAAASPQEEDLQAGGSAGVGVRAVLAAHPRVQCAARYRHTPHQQALLPAHSAAVSLCAMSSSCCNPFLYAWLHDRFRTELRKMFKCNRRIGAPANNCAATVVL
ncbi:hypothetical protein WMY93_024938 [Mugilogobius chulae]|uniref:G-protein coupled receptors family 1 profile domain-containing protein n=1 Tax=Mugilogobius chulae TaxID=88201 RepID=A0AAW0N4A4_9GOBI